MSWICRALVGAGVALAMLASNGPELAKACPYQTQPTCVVEDVEGLVLPLVKPYSDYAVQEAVCAEGQVTNPSSNGDSTCQAVGTVVRTAGGGIATVLGLAGYGSQEAICVAGRVSNP